MIGGEWEQSFAGKRADLLAGRRKVGERLEVMSGPTGRRSWPDALKARIVAESFERGARVVDVARRHEVVVQHGMLTP